MKKRLYLFLFISVIYFSQSCKDKGVTSTINKTHEEPLPIKYNDINFKTVTRNIENAKNENNLKRLGAIYFAIGHYYSNKNKTDSAFYYFNHSKEEFLLLKDSSNIGKNLLNMSILQANEGDFYGSEETATEALKYFKPPKDDNYIASVYNSLAISKTEQKDYPQAIEYYNLSLKIPKKKLLELNIKNNQAVVNIKAKKYLSAIHILSGLIKDSILNDNINLKIRIEDNLVYAQWLNNKDYNGEPEMNRTLKVRENKNDLSGQIASHSHLSDYFTKTNIQKAIYHADKMYNISSQAGTPDDRLEALQKLIRLEKPEQIKKYFSIYLNLNDSLQTERNRAKNQFALIRYEVEKNKEENLRLKAENAQKNYQILQQQVMVFSIFGLSFLGLVLFIVWFKRRQERFKREKMEVVHRTELKYSKKIHDEVANSIYYLMIQLENNSSMKTDKITDNLEELYNRSRNISHESELKTDMKNDFVSLLRDMLQPYGSKDTKIIIIGNEQQIWDKLSINKREEIYYVLIELMTNMKKHSKSNLVTLKFKEDNNKISIDYFDNGIGLAKDNWKPGKGIRNIENRLSSIQGKINFMTENRKGLSIKIIITI